MSDDTAGQVSLVHICMMSFLLDAKINIAELLGGVS